MHRSPLAALLLAAAALLLSRGAPAQDLEPRLYTNVPLGMNFLGVGYGYSEGNVLFDPAVLLDNAAIEISFFFSGIDIVG